MNYRFLILLCAPITHTTYTAFQSERITLPAPSQTTYERKRTGNQQMQDGMKRAKPIPSTHEVQKQPESPRILIVEKKPLHPRERR